MDTSRQAIHIDGDRVLVPATVFDHEGFRRWVKSGEFPEHLRAAFVDGEVLIQMSPESLETHNKVKAEVTIVIGQYVRDRDLGEVYADGALLTNSAARLSCEPDLLFVSWATSEANRVRFVPRAQQGDEYIEINGTPDLVVEIVSDSSVRKDEVLLRNAYLRAGIPEYWLIDARKDALRFEILHNHEAAFQPSATAGAPQESRVLGGRWTLDRSHNRLGRFAYRLETR
jgi:Uma2 family endonuclease